MNNGTQREPLSKGSRNLRDLAIRTTGSSPESDAHGDEVRPGNITGSVEEVGTEHRASSEILVGIGERRGIKPDDLHAWIVALDERVTTVEIILGPLLQQVRRGLLQVVRAIEKLDLL